MKYILEACVDSVEAAVAAQEAGVDRIELCSALQLGGLTPSPGQIAQSKKLLTIPIFVLIRPRAGDFCYSDLEFDLIRRDIDALKSAGIEGVVVGVLLPDGNLDMDRMRLLVEQARPMEVTFHRAFDRCRNPELVLEQLIELGIERVLTSGQMRSAIEGADLLGKLVAFAAGRITIMPGGGINPENVLELARKTGAREIHFSALQMADGKMTWRNPAFGGQWENCRLEALPEKVSAVRKALEKATMQF